MEQLSETDISVKPARRNSIKLKLTVKDLEENDAIIRDAVVQAERWSHTQGGEA